MILLTPTSDIIRLVTSSAANLDIAAFYADINGSTVTPGNQLTTIGSITTTTIVGAPSADTRRTIRHLSIRNRHASTINTVTIEIFNGTTSFELRKVSLAAGEELYYDEAAGWIYVNAQGLPKVAQALGSSSVAVSELNVAVLAADVVNNNAVANTIADVTGLSFAVTAGETYWFKFAIWHTAAATSTGSRWTINGPAFTRLGAVSKVTLGVANSSGTDVFTETPIIAYDNPTTSNASSATVAGGNFITIEGVILPSASGSVIARFASEISSSAITALAGSHVQWMRVL